ncbi:12882_t:CDS:2, partial [Racocetra persica]
MEDNFFLDDSVWECFIRKLTKETDDFEYFVQKIAGVYGVLADEVKVYQDNNCTDIIVKYIDSKQEKHFIYLNYDNERERVDAATHGISNWAKGHTFESDLHKLFNQNGIIAHIIQVTEGDEFKSTMTHFKNSLEILVYNSKTMKTKKYLTKQAKLWLDNSSQQII